MKIIFKTTTLVRALHLSFSILFVASVTAQPYLLQPDRVFDGKEMHSDWVVVVEGEYIRDAGPVKSIKVPQDARRIKLDGMTLMPGLIEGHSHLLLHPYDEAA